jgi:hypothetical protein
MKEPELWSNPWKIPKKMCHCGIEYYDEPVAFKLHMRNAKHINYCAKYLFK